MKNDLKSIGYADLKRIGSVQLRNYVVVKIFRFCNNIKLKQLNPNC
jgi:hypothetical protein